MDLKIIANRTPLAVARRLSDWQEMLHLLIATIIFHCSFTNCYECFSRCNFATTPATVNPTLESSQCLIQMPDNPIEYQNETLPCQLDVVANCTKFCHININFEKFHLPVCEEHVVDSLETLEKTSISPTPDENTLTYANNVHQKEYCKHVNSCEYVVLIEQGINDAGVEVEFITSFHGNKTSDIYVSKTDRVRLQFCYRSETFSARNIQLHYTLYDPSTDVDPPLFHWSIYMLGTFVILFIVAAVMIRWSPWLKPCLDPPPEKTIHGITV